MLKESDFVKLQVGVPKTHAEALRQAMGDAGAGVQGNYRYCSASFPCTGRFLPLEGARPAIGRPGVSEVVEEEIIQTICHKDKLTGVLRAIREVHPYEEPPIDIIPRLEWV
ncbi:MAG: hypothetical protein HYY51_00275 [Candidatus Magasanikbacteria bacterium]|nr:hypothetical protein [Candidatus Magasanikbacteria bacterium]